MNKQRITLGIAGAVIAALALAGCSAGKGVDIGASGSASDKTLSLIHI